MPAPAPPRPSPRRYYLLTSPRTASNLLQKMLAYDAHPHILPCEGGGYFFFATIVQRLQLSSAAAGRPLAAWTDAEKASLRASYQASFDALQEHVDSAAEQGKDVFVKEHAPWLIQPVAESAWVFGEGEGAAEEQPWMVESAAGQTRSRGNETVLPDEFLKTWRPTFLIRHPALVFPSLYRTTRDLKGAEAARTALAHQKLEMTLRWVRGLHDWFVEHLDAESGAAGDAVDGVTWPIVLDADDVMLRPDIVRRYAGLVGLDEGRLRFEWEQVSDEALGKMGAAVKRMRSTLVASKGVVEGKTAVGLDMDVEAEKWRAEFGAEEGARIEGFVREAMGDYEYLRGKRLRAVG